MSKFAMFKRHIRMAECRNRKRKLYGEYKTTEDKQTPAKGA
jgi:hypothetical protein